MGLRIRTNISSMNAQRRLERSTRSVSDSASKLSSGKRINRAADDAAGLYIASNINNDVRSLQQAKKNANDGIFLL